jgi:hypothetical protein
LRAADHTRARIESYQLQVEPEPHRAERRLCGDTIWAANVAEGPAGAGPLEAKFGQNQSFEAGAQLSLTTPSSDKPSGIEVFRSDLDWYVGHARSLAMSPEDCCTDQGHYLVAGELFYLLLQPTSLLDDPLGQLDSEQKAALERLRHSVRQVPVEARSGGATAAESLANMRHQAWELPRRLADEFVAAFAPLMATRDLNSSPTQR